MIPWGPIIGAGATLLGGWLGGKSRSGGTTPTAPDYLRSYGQGAADMGWKYANQPWQNYQGPRTAAFSPDTLNAFNMVRNAVGTTQPYYSSALDTAGRLQNSTINPQQVQASQWAGTDLSPYMNPYTENVVDASMADLENQRAVQYNGLASQAQAAGAFGGSRFGVAQGQFEADALRNKSLLASQLRNQGFETAAGLASQDVDRLNQAKYANQAFDFQGQTATADMQNRNAFLSGILGDRLGDRNLLDAESMGRIGGVQQQQQQTINNVGYDEWLDQTQRYPERVMGWLNNSLMPGTAISGLQAAAPTGGGLLGALGGAQLGAQVGNSIYDWWKGMTPAAPKFDPYDSYNDWQG